jgi:hypothetical protein
MKKITFILTIISLLLTGYGHAKRPSQLVAGEKLINNELNYLN